MATIIYGSTKIETPDNKPIIDACKKGGIPFGCEDGSCGTCIVIVEEGMNNLSSPHQKEKELGIEPPQRLACQCVIRKGIVKMKGMEF